MLFNKFFNGCSGLRVTPVKRFRIKLTKASSEVGLHVLQGIPFFLFPEKILALSASFYLSTFYKTETLFLRDSECFNFHERKSALPSTRQNATGWETENP